MKDVDIIVCTRNNEQIIEKCLDSIKNQSFKNFNCVAVDDCSSDGTAEIIRKKYPWVKLIIKKKQTGPAESRNIAIKETEGEFIASVDSDVFLNQHWVREQMSLLRKNKKAAIAASRILYSWDKHKLNSLGGGMTKLGFGFDMHRGELYNTSGQGRVFYGHSAAMMIRRKALEDTGLFDGEFFYGNEDTDLGWRANISGWDVLFNHRAVAYHEENSTVKTMPRSVAFHGAKNRIRSLIKNYSAARATKYLPMHVLLVAGYSIINSDRTAYLKAIAWNLMNINTTIKERNKVQQARKVGDKRIEKMMTGYLPKLVHDLHQNAHFGSSF